MKSKVGSALALTGVLVEAWGETEKGMNTNELVELALGWISSKKRDGLAIPCISLRVHGLMVVSWSSFSHSL